MNNFDTDHHARMLLPREHALELRDAWNAANGRNLGQKGETGDPCSDGRYRAFTLVVARLFADTSRGPSRATTGPCS